MVDEVALGLDFLSVTSVSPANHCSNYLHLFPDVCNILGQTKQHGLSPQVEGLMPDSVVGSLHTEDILKLRGRSPQANYTARATSACRRS
jgi:hypothetical protein